MPDGWGKILDPKRIVKLLFDLEAERNEQAAAAGPTISARTPGMLEGLLAGQPLNWMRGTPQQRSQQMARALLPGQPSQSLEAPTTYERLKQWLGVQNSGPLDVATDVAKQALVAPVVEGDMLAAAGLPGKPATAARMLTEAEQIATWNKFEKLTKQLASGAKRQNPALEQFSQEVDEIAEGAGMQAFERALREGMPADATEAAHEYFANKVLRPAFNARIADLTAERAGGRAAQQRQIEQAVARGATPEEARKQVQYVNRVADKQATGAEGDVVSLTEQAASPEQDVLERMVQSEAQARSGVGQAPSQALDRPLRELVKGVPASKLNATDRQIVQAMDQGKGDLNLRTAAGGVSQARVTATRRKLSELGLARDYEHPSKALMELGWQPRDIELAIDIVARQVLPAQKISWGPVAPMTKRWLVQGRSLEEIAKFTGRTSIPQRQQTAGRLNYMRQQVQKVLDLWAERPEELTRMRRQFGGR